jgi:hypothetical protein
VSEVISNVAYTVDEELLSRYRVDVVCVGVERDNGDIPPDPMTGEANLVCPNKTNLHFSTLRFVFNFPSTSFPLRTNLQPGADPYALPKRMGKFIKVNSASDMTTTKIVDRIIENR